MLTSLRTAVGHLSIIPLGSQARKVAEGREGEVLVFFPFAGLLVGVAPAAVLVLATLATHRGSLLAAALTVAAMALVTGAANLVNLAATTDAVASGLPRTEALAEHNGDRLAAPGAVAMALSLLVKFGAIMGLTSALEVTGDWRSSTGFLVGAIVAILLASTLGRWAAVVLAAYSEYARPEGGEDEWMVRYCGAREFRWVLVPVAAVSAAAAAAGLLKYSQLGWLQVVLAVLGALAVAYFASLFFERRFGGVTGRQMGAVAELAETATLAICAMSALQL